jgi:ribosome-associated toxin RatA of RatAB toxin-antitoxin module
MNRRSVWAAIFLGAWSLVMPAFGSAQTPSGDASGDASGAAGWTDPPPRQALAPGDMERLRAGEVLVRDTRIDEAGGAGIAMAVYHVEPSRLWAIIGDCAANRRFVRGLEACQITGETDTGAVTWQRLKPYAMLPALEYRFETRREPYRWIRIRLLDGDLRALSGSWRFDRLSDAAILVTHEIRVRPPYPVPRWLARRTVQRDLAALMACLRWEAKAWPEPRQRGMDRQACPGRSL